MESRSSNQRSSLHSCTPTPSPNPSSIFRDISNFKTPKNPSQKTLVFQSSPQQQFFTASKNTPASTARRSFKPSSLKSKTARKLKAFELEQSKSARKAQIDKEKSLKSLARSLTVWLNFLFENPDECGCDPTGGSNAGDRLREVVLGCNGKRELGSGCKVGLDGPWRGPKRHKVLQEGKIGISGKLVSGLRDSLKEICSLEDLKERMRMYLSLDCCKDVLEAVAQVAKNIDEGRLKMRMSCPIVTDVGMKEKAMRILMCYNPVWLRVGLYIVLGGDSLLQNVDENSEHENAFLRMVIEKQFFSHSGLAKAYSYNKMVEGLYRPGYYEKLGSVILKRFLLLAIVLDKAKFHSSLPLKYGIDGVDGGSPPLFSSNTHIKSSRQLIVDFLSSDVMHGEGNVLTHLVIVGYKVSYQQNPLNEYDFKINDLFADLHDGVRLCRAIQLLKCDPSILMKVVVPSDTQKKNQVNCGIALQYLKHAGVPLVDQDGTEIIAEDVVHEDKELTLSLLWNMFVHVQLPLLINKTLLAEEILNIRGDAVENSSSQTHLELLLNWIKVICEIYELKIGSYSSLLDGRAMWCLLDYYFRKEYGASCSLEGPDRGKQEVSIMSAVEYTDAVHNFILSQKLSCLLGNFPEVLQVSDILEHNGACNGQSVIVLLVFLSVQLLVKRNMDKLNFNKLLGFNCHNTSSSCLSDDGNNGKDAGRDFKVVMAWWQDMAQQTNKLVGKPAVLADRKGNSIQRENAATIIQSQYRRLVEQRKYLRIIDAALVIQTATLAWLSLKQHVSSRSLNARIREKQMEKFQMYTNLLVDRHYFINLKRSTLIIQRAIRAWILQRRCNSSVSCNEICTTDQLNAAVVLQSWVRVYLARSVYRQMFDQEKQDSMIEHQNRMHHRQIIAAKKIQHHWKQYLRRKFIHCQCYAATKIQSYVRGWLAKKNAEQKKKAIITIQRCFRCSRNSREVKILKSETSAIVIQSYLRRWIALRRACRERHLVIVVQSYVRRWLQRKEFLQQRDTAVKLQSILRCMKHHNAFSSLRHAAINIQSVVRGQNTRKRLLGASCYHHMAPMQYFQARKFKKFLQSVVKLQRWWRTVAQVKKKTKSAVVIQSHFRGWISRQLAKKEQQQVVVIQSYWRGYQARKDAKHQLIDLRLRMQKSAANVDDNRRLINRLIAALSELLSMRSVSGILHTCATLDEATQLSEKCCEELVAAGAISTLLKLIRSMSRSIPDQQVLKHALSTLRNLARYPHLTQILVKTHGCAETIILEFFRNKEDGFFIASELLKKICSYENGVKSIPNLTALLKRLNNLVDELSKKIANDKRNRRNLASREHAERRLREVVELLHYVSNAR